MFALTDVSGSSEDVPGGTASAFLEDAAEAPSEPGSPSPVSSSDTSEAGS